MKKIHAKAYFILGTVIILSLAALLILLGSERMVLSEKMRDYYIPIFEALRSSGKVFGQDCRIPIMGLIDRDALFHETTIVNLIFLLLPAFPAVVIAFIAKMAVALLGTFLLNKELVGDKAEETGMLALILGIAIGLLPVDAYYYLAIASLPLITYLIFRLEKEASVSIFIAFFLFPVLSEFFHLGLYIVLAIIVYAMVKFCRNRKTALRVFACDFLLCLGYILTQYRAIRLIYNGQAYWWSNIIDVWQNKENLVEEISLLAVATVVIVIPIIFLSCSKKIESECSYKKVSVIAIVIAACLLLVPIEGNVLTGWILADENIRLKNYYQEDFFDEVKSDINYLEQWSCSYGMPSSMLIYNGFRVIDGDTVLDTLYTEAYSEAFGFWINNESDCTSETLPVIDAESFKDFGGRLLFAAKPMEGATENGWILLDSKSGDDIQPSLYVYQTASRYKAKEHSNVPFAERKGFSYDLQDYQNYKDEMFALIDEANTYRDRHEELTDSEIVSFLDEERFRYLYHAMLDEKEKIEAAYLLVEIEYYQNIYDEELQEIMNQYYADAIDFTDDLNITIREAAESPYKEVLIDLTCPEVVDGILEYEELTEEEKDISLRLESLSQEYELASMDEYYFEYNGVEWSFEKFNEESSDMEEDEMYAVYNGLYKEKAKVVGEIYKEIIQLNNRRAQIHGYDDYVDMAYEETFCRDYTAEQITKVFSEIKECNLYIYEIGYLNESLYEYDPGYITTDDRATYEMLYPYIKDIDSELGDSLKYLLDNDLFDLELSEDKPDKGYSVSLDSFGDAFIFDSPYGTSGDLYTYVHEFGHYNAFYANKAPDFQDFNNLDISEIQSQGLELLMARNYDCIYDENTAKFLECQDVSRIVDVVNNGSIVAEFEIYAFKHPDASADELSRQMMKIYNEHGMYFKDAVEGVYSWEDTPHIFSAPLYYVSYMTSGLAALELYDLSYENYDLAVEKYMEISALDATWRYSEACEFVDLPNMFDKKVVSNLMRNIYVILKNKIG